MSMLTEKEFFKVKKINFKNKQPFVGVIIPMILLDESNNTFNFSKERCYVYNIYLMKEHEFRLNDENIIVSAVKLSPEVRELSKQLINQFKEKVKIGKEIELLKVKDASNSEKCEVLIKAMKDSFGFITNDELQDIIRENFPDFELYCYSTGTTISCLGIRKQKTVCKYPHEGDYDFIYQDYDRMTCIENPEETSDFKKLSKKYFPGVKKCSKKISKNIEGTIDIEVEVDSSLFICENANLDFKKPIEKTQKNIDLIISSFKKLLA